MHRAVFLFFIGLLAFGPTGMAEPLASESAINWSKRYEQAQDLMHEGKTAEAIAMGQQTVALAEKALPPGDASLIVSAQYELAQLYLLEHHFPEAEQLLIRNLEMSERSYGPNDLRVAQPLYDLGWFYSNLANYAKAEPLFLRALDIDEKALGRRHHQTASVLNSLGVMCENKGDYPRAETYFLEALSIQNETLGSDTLPTSNTLNNLATLYWSEGDYLRAKKYFAQALTIRERLRGRGSLVTATTVNNLALVDLSMGDYEHAEVLFWRVLRIREQRLGVNHPLTLTTVDHLGMLYYDLKDYQAAESFLARAALAREKAIGVDQPDTARAIFHLACLYDMMGQYAKAEPLHERALDIRLRVLGADHPETAGSYGFLARHYHLMGQLDKAAPLYQKALDAQKSAGPDHPDRLKTLENFACLELDLKHPEQALALAKQSATIREHLLQNLFIFTSEKQRIDFQKTLNFYNLPASIGDPEQIALVVYRTKGVVLDSMIEDRQAAKAAKDPETLALLEKLRSIAREQEAMHDPTDGKSIAAPIGVQSHEDLEREADRLRTAIGERLNLARNTRRALQVKPAAVAAAVPDGSAVVEYVRYNAYEKNLKFTASYGALIQAKGQPLHWITLGAAAAIENHVSLYKKYVRRRVRDTIISTILKRLYEQLWQPVTAALPADCRRVILSPDADLNSISFATLLTPENQFICEKYAIEYVSSARDLLEGSRELVRSGGEMAVFAAPEFGGKSKMTDPVDEIQLAALPGTQMEADYLQKQGPAWGFTVNIYTGKDATKAQLISLTAPTVLHLATHGLYWNGGPKKKSAPTSTGTPDNAVSSPIELSMLALAGAQDTFDAWQRGEAPLAEDGILTAGEVSGLNLQGTWLVVLSACDTGMGQPQAGEGVMGLRRGFLLAGTQNLLMTLWPIGDVDTVSFMEAFYPAAIQKRNAAQALSTVQTERLVALRQEKGIWQAVRSAGPFILNY